MLRHFLLRAAPLFFLVLAQASTAMSLAPPFTDHAVLQRDKSVPVWGRAEPGESVTVVFHGQTVATTADRDGRWMAWLGPATADIEGADLTVSGKTTVVLHDVVVGEVWLCSGQSNMEFVLDDASNAVFRVQDAPDEVAAARFPLIRQFKVPHRVAAAPAETAEGNWVPCTPQTAANFTAVGYFFARDLYSRLNVPVGLLNCTWDETVIESWLSPSALAADPAFAAVGERWRRMVEHFSGARAEYDAALAEWNRALGAARAKGPAATASFFRVRAEPRPPHGFGPQDPWTPAGAFNGMMHPLAPYALRGILWYQGESNVEEAQEYRRFFPALIGDWRAQFGQGDVPFYWVQLPNYRSHKDATDQQWAYLREAQARALGLPATGQAVTIDVGDSETIHPRNKQEVGRRLALIARANIYGIPCDYSGPVFSGATREGSALRVHFRFADNGLTAAGRPLQSFELAGADGRYHPADAKISGDTVVVRSPEVPAPVAVRYAWRNAPEANLFNGAGLPAAPFRSDGG